MEECSQVTLEYDIDIWMRSVLVLHRRLRVPEQEFKVLSANSATAEEPQDSMRTPSCTSFVSFVRWSTI